MDQENLELRLKTAGFTKEKRGLWNRGMDEFFYVSPALEPIGNSELTPRYVKLDPGEFAGPSEGYFQFRSDYFSLQEKYAEIQKIGEEYNLWNSRANGSGFSQPIATGVGLLLGLGVPAVVNKFILLPSEVYLLGFLGGVALPREMVMWYFERRAKNLLNDWQNSRFEHLSQLIDFHQKYPPVSGQKEIELALWRKGV